MNGPSLLNYAYSLTVDDLIRMIPEIESKFPKDKMPPNPADVHPATFAALKNICDKPSLEKSFLPQNIVRVDAIVLHVRTDVEPWKLHPCTCKEDHTQCLPNH
jgi:hypothetical protein